MKQYKIVSILWEDASTFSSQPLPIDLEGLIIPSITLGILYKKTKQHVVIASHIERYEDRDEADYMVIRRDSILSIQEYGHIPLRGLRAKEGST